VLDDDKYEIEADADDYRFLLEAVAGRLEQLAAGHLAGRPWDASHIVAEIGRVAKEIRSVLNEGD
jgi:hypothetical protein